MKIGVNKNKELRAPQREKSSKSALSCGSRAKQEALEAIGKLPDDVDMDEIMYRLYVLDKVRKGREDVEAGRTIAHEDLLRELEQW